MEVTPLRLTLAGGRGMALWARPPAAAGSSETLVLMLHGFGDDCVFPLWHWIDEFVARGLSVLTIDWDGHGAGSDSVLRFDRVEETIPLVLRQLTGTVAAGLPALGRYRTRLLFGHSLGGALALLAAARHDVAAVMTGLVLLSPALALGGTGGMLREARSMLSPRVWRRDLAPLLPWYGLRGMFPAFGPYRRDDFPLRLADGRNYVVQCAAFLDRRFGQATGAETSRLPVTWFHGARDGIAPLDAVGPRLAARAPVITPFVDETRGHAAMVYSGDVARRVARSMTASGTLP